MVIWSCLDTEALLKSLQSSSHRRGGGGGGGWFLDLCLFKRSKVRFKLIMCLRSSLFHFLSSVCLYQWRSNTNVARIWAVCAGFCGVPSHLWGVREDSPKNAEVYSAHFDILQLTHVHVLRMLFNAFVLAPHF